MVGKRAIVPAPLGSYEPSALEDANRQPVVFYQPIGMIEAGGDLLAGMGVRSHSDSCPPGLGILFQDSGVRSAFMTAHSQG